MKKIISVLVFAHVTLAASNDMAGRLVEILREAGRQLRNSRRDEIVATATPLQQPDLDVLTPHEEKMKIGKKYSNPHLDWKQLITNIPSNIGEAVYPGVRLQTIPKITPNNVPNSAPVPNSVPMPLSIQVSVPNNEPIMDISRIGIKQPPLSNNNPLTVDEAKEAIKVRRRFLNRFKKRVAARSQSIGRAADDWHHTRSGARPHPNSVGTRVQRGYYKKPPDKIYGEDPKPARNKKGLRTGPNRESSSSSGKGIVLIKKKHHQPKDQTQSKLSVQKNNISKKKFLTKNNKPPHSKLTVKKKDGRQAMRLRNLQNLINSKALDVLRTREKSEDAAYIVYGNNQNIGIQYGNREPYRLKYNSFRRSGDDYLSKLIEAYNRNIKRKKSQRQWQQRKPPVILIGSPESIIKFAKQDGLKELLSNTVSMDNEESDNAAEEIFDGDSKEDYLMAKHSWRRNKKSDPRVDLYSENGGNQTEGKCKNNSDSSSSGESSNEKNPGNPFTIWKSKYKQNWLWNHFMDGDHMNINPLGPKFANQGPSGAALFFGRKWWYFNQDDYKPFR